MKCLICGSNCFTAHQVLHVNVIVDENGTFVDNMPDGLEASVYDSDAPFGPFTCCKCGTEYDNPDNSLNWVITDNPFTDPDTVIAAQFRAADAKTHKLITLHLLRIKDDVWTIDVYDTTFGMPVSGPSLIFRKENVTYSKNAVKTAIMIFDNMPTLLDSNTYSFEQIK